jgi:inorganic triphosphatase YgiF
VVPHLEVEDKYDVSEDVKLPDLRQLDGVADVRWHPPLNLEAVYFDTLDRLLAAAGVALRRRLGGVDDGWHIKVALESGKLEFAVPSGSDEVVPARIRTALASLTLASSLAPVARIRTTRHPIILTDSSAKPLAEIVDDHVVGHRLERSEPMHKPLNS